MASLYSSNQMSQVGKMATVSIFVDFSLTLPGSEVATGLRSYEGIQGLTAQLILGGQSKRGLPGQSVMTPGQPKLAQDPGA